MHLKLPFKRDLFITKRGISVLDDDKLIAFSEWASGKVFSTKNTPIVEGIYSAFATEFAKIDIQHIVDKNGKYEHRYDELNYIVSERPNPLQSKFDFMYTMGYQLIKCGNALAFIMRDKSGKVIEIDPVNVEDYEFGGGFTYEKGCLTFKYKNKKDNSIVLVDYNNVIHLRLNPNNVFYGDFFGEWNDSRAITDLIDSALSALINELKDNGTIRGIVKIGSSNIGYANGFANRTMADQKEKVSKQEEIIKRIKATKGGVLVLDAGEDWINLDSPFETACAKDIDKYVDLLMFFKGFNKKIVSGEATAEEMEVGFNQKIAPRVEQFISELNYKVFSKTAKAQGHRFEYRRDMFEYIPITQAIDVMYKGLQDTTTNERRRMIYKLPPVENGDVIVINKNFEPLDEFLDYYNKEEDDGKDYKNG